MEADYSFTTQITSLSIVHLASEKATFLFCLIWRAVTRDITMKQH